jgi:5-methylcytosine-specific restriction endonuclease McrA
MAIACKICSKCGIEKPLEDFYRTSSGRGIGGRRADCKECCNRASVIRVAEWRNANPVKKGEQDKRYRGRVGCDVLYERSKRCVSKNPAYYAMCAAQWRAENPDKAKEVGRRYRESHPDSVRLWNAGRRAVKKGTEGTFICMDWEAMKGETGYRCVYCGERFDQLTIDHVVPLIKGGKHSVDNIVPACQSCNSRKGTKSLLMFLYGGMFA